MSVVVGIEETGACRRQLRVEVPAPAVEAEMQRVTLDYRRAARLPGFRKGKVPLELVRKRFEADIRQEVLDRLIPRFWRQAQAETRLEPLLPPRVDEVEFEPGSPLTFAATIEVRPPIELGDFRSFELPELSVEATDEEVEAALEDLRRNRAEWVDAARAAARGDLVVGSLAELGADGEPAGAAQPVTFELGDESVWEELSLAATGREAGQQAEFERRAGDEGAATRYRLQVERVRERDLPPLDDAFAAALGDFADLGALRLDLAARLRQGKLEERRRRRERAVLDQLRQRHPVELPQGVVDRETERLVQDYARMLAGGGVDLERADVDWQRVAGEMRPQAEKEVHARLLLDAIAEELGVEVAEAEFERQLAAVARAQGRTTPALRKELDQAGRLDELRSRMRRGKTLRRLLGEEPEPEPAAPPGADSARNAGGADDVE